MDEGRKYFLRVAAISIVLTTAIAAFVALMNPSLANPIAVAGLAGMGFFVTSSLFGSVLIPGRAWGAVLLIGTLAGGACLLYGLAGASFFRSGYGLGVYICGSVLAYLLIRPRAARMRRNI
ncbi:MAG TPA: hypothetical protein VG797_01825 [Phycisphaerales bacterium]|nr:hypothetical protein [Phycisphaerales bacterium]